MIMPVPHNLNSKEFMQWRVQHLAFKEILGRRFVLSPVALGLLGQTMSLQSAFAISVENALRGTFFSKFQKRRRQSLEESREDRTKSEAVFQKQGDESLAPRIATLEKRVAKLEEQIEKLIRSWNARFRIRR